MRGSAVLRTGVAPGGALAGPWVQNSLWTRARAVPSLDLRFADNKSLVDATTGAQLVTFTRASTGTFVGSDGVLRSAVTNLLLQSEDFSTTWANTDSTEASNVETAPNGTLTADKLIPDVGVTSGQFRQDVSKAATATTYTCSVYGKAAEFNRLSIRVEHNGSTGNRADVGFSLSDGSVVSAAAALGTFSGASATVTSVGAGWYRFTLSFTSSTETSIRVRLFGFDSSLPCNGTSGIYIWGAQLEQSATVGEYIPTTSTINSAPRFDHNPTTGESLGLLVEEARTNSIRNNTMVGAVAGTPGTLPTNWGIDVPGLTTSVIGTGTSNGISYIDIRLNGTTSASYGNIFFESSSGIAATNAQTWAHSLWLSTVGGTTTNLGTIRHAFDLYSSTSSYLTTVVSNLTGLSASQSRFSAALTTNNASTAFARPSLSMLWSSGAAIDITLRIGLPQLEQGAFATSVIPTTTATVTRAADVASITGSNFGTTRTNLLVRSEEFDNASWSKLRSTITANAITAPNGTQTADLQIATSVAGTHKVFQSATFAGQTGTASVYAKAGGYNWLFLIFSASGDTGVYFNLSNGTIGTVSAGYTASITSAGDGWYRCSVSITTTSASWFLNTLVATADGTSSFTGNDSSGIYIWGAQLEVGSAATPYIQSPSVFTSRASSGTYVGGNGLIQTAVTNLLLRSEEFDNASWLAGEATITANQIVAPNGLTTADLYTTSANTGVEHFIHQTFTAPASTTYTASVYAKAGTSPGFDLQYRVAGAWAGGNVIVSFNLSTQVATITAGTATASITPVGNGWFRCGITATSSVAGGSPQFRIATGDGGGTIYIWGAQLEQASTVGEYIPTTSTINSAARYDHDPISLISKGLLLEEARTNVVTWSQDFSQADWTKNASTVVTTAVASPIQGVNYQKIEATSANTTVGITSVAVTAATQQRAVSFFAQPLGNISRVLVVVQGADARINVNLADGTFTTNAAATGSTVAVSGQRFSVSTPTLTNATGVRLFLKQTGDTDTNTPTTIAIGEGLYLIGAQMEVGAFPTSYIPTTTATVTRAADISTSVATSVFESSWYRQDEGTVFSDSSIIASQVKTQAVWELTGGAVLSSLRQPQLTANQFRAVIGGTFTGSPGTGASLTTGVTFAAVAYSGTAGRLQVGSVGTDTTGSALDATSLSIGSLAGLTQLNGRIKRLTYWPTRLGNEVLQRITQ